MAVLVTATHVFVSGVFKRSTVDPRDKREDDEKRGTRASPDAVMAALVAAIHVFVSGVFNRSTVDPRDKREDDEKRGTRIPHAVLAARFRPSKSS